MTQYYAHTLCDQNMQQPARCN